MGFGKTLKRAAGAVSTGGLSELVGYKGFGNPFDPNEVTQSQVPLETPEQAVARRALLRFAQTGQYGDFKAGAEVPLGYGDYNVTDLEREGLSTLEDLIASGIPGQYKLADEALKDMLGSTEEQIRGQFDPFVTQTNRQIRDAETALKRGAGFAGNLYSTDTIRGLGDIHARGNETLTSELARLTDSALNRRMNAVPLAFRSAEGQEALRLGRVAASQEFGSLTRRLNDAKIKARDAEILRRRSELGLPIEAAKAVAGQNANFGVPSVTTTTPSQMTQLLELIIRGGSLFAGAKG